MRLILGLLILVAMSSPGTAGTIGADNRLPIADYAKQHGMDAVSARKLFGASGRIMCPSYAANAFLVHRGDIVMTARHVVIPESGANAHKDWKRPINCRFELSAAGITSSWYDVDVKSIIFPTNPLRSPSDRFDWIAMKLTGPIAGVQPYKLSGVPAKISDIVTSVTLRQDGLPHHSWNERIVETCRVRDIIDIDQISGSGLKTDCSATKGASGGAVVRAGADGLQVVGVLTATTRSCKQYRALSCFSFAVGISEDVKRAIRSLADD
jgi:hypothetical protein